MIEINHIGEGLGVGIDGNYPYFQKNIENNPFVWRTMHYYRYPKFYKYFKDIYMKVYNISKITSGNIVSKYQATFTHIHECVLSYPSKEKSEAVFFNIS